MVISWLVWALSIAFLPYTQIGKYIHYSRTEVVYDNGKIMSNINSLKINCIITMILLLVTPYNKFRRRDWWTQCLLIPHVMSAIVGSNSLHEEPKQWSVTRVVYVPFQNCGDNFLNIGNHVSILVTWVLGWGPNIFWAFWVKVSKFLP